jgi:tetratricopeptide (TPR) repeat protein
MALHARGFTAQPRVPRAGARTRPGFALPYVGLADYHLALAAVGAESSLDAMPKARELAQRALTVDPDLPEAQAMLGIVAGVLDYDWQELERRIQVATARDPLLAHLRQWKAYFHVFSIGRPEQARQLVAEIIEDDPLCLMWHFTLALTLAALGREDEANGALRRALELDPQFWIGWMLQGLLHALHGRHAESFDCAEKSLASAPWAPGANGLMAAVYANAGRASDAEPMLNALHSHASAGPLGMAYHFLARGDMDRAVEWASKGADQRIASLVTIRVRPFEPRLPTSPAWPALLKKLNLTPAV